MAVGDNLRDQTYRLPAHVSDMVEDRDFLDYYDDCTFVRAVAFGEPPPPGYEPEPSFLDAAPASD